MMRSTAQLALVVLCLTAFAAGTSVNRAQAGTIVRYNTRLGHFDVELFDSIAPVTVAKFLQNVTAGNHNGSIVHRSVPDFVIQGGGFDTNLDTVANFGTIPLEYNLPNERGTLAMARTHVPNSATTQWFINVVDNSATLAPIPSVSDGYAVFGRVLGDGMDVVDAINDLMRVQMQIPFNELPVVDYSSGPVSPRNLVEIYSITVVPEPSSLVLAAIAGAAVIGIARRRRRLV